MQGLLDAWTLFQPQPATKSNTGSLDTSVGKALGYLGLENKWSISAFRTPGGHLRLENREDKRKQTPARMLSPYSRLSRPLQMGANIMGAVLSVLYAARNGLMDCEVSCELFASAAAMARS